MHLPETRQFGAGIVLAVALLFSAAANASPLLSDYRFDPTGISPAQDRLWLARNYASMAGPDSGRNSDYTASYLSTGNNWSKEQTRFVRLGPGDHRWAAKPLPFYSQSNKERLMVVSFAR